MMKISATDARVKKESFFVLIHMSNVVDVLRLILIN